MRQAVNRISRLMMSITQLRPFKHSKQHNLSHPTILSLNHLNQRSHIAAELVVKIGQSQTKISTSTSTTKSTQNLTALQKGYNLTKWDLTMHMYRFVTSAWKYLTTSRQRCVREATTEASTTSTPWALIKASCSISFAYFARAGSVTHFHRIGLSRKYKEASRKIPFFKHSFKSKKK